MELLRVKNKNRYDYFLKPSKYRGYVRFNALGHNIMHGLDKPNGADELNIDDYSTWIASDYNGDPLHAIDGISDKIMFIINIYNDQAV